LNRVPDAMEPVFGWRAWALGALLEHNDGPASAIALKSVTWPQEPWPAGRPAVASCHLGHEAPGCVCTCGIHAFRHATDLRTVFQPDILDAPPTVVGPVLGWGTVAMHERGWRAKFAYPEALALVCTRCLARGQMVKTATAAISRHWGIVVGRCAECGDNSATGPGRFHASDVLRALCSRYGVPPILIGAPAPIAVGDTSSLVDQDAR
jgi:hypothetical protein